MQPLLSDYWEIHLSDEVEQQKGLLIGALIKTITASSFKKNPSKAVEEPERDYRDFRILLDKLDALQLRARNLDESLPAVHSGGLTYPYERSGVWRCYFRRDPERKIAVGFLITRNGYPQNGTNGTGASSKWP